MFLGTRMDGHGFCHADVFFEHEFLEYNEFTMRMCIFILPQMAQMDTDLYSLNTNTCIVRENSVEINNPQNSDGRKSV